MAESDPTGTPTGTILMSVGIVNGHIAVWVAPFMESRPVLQEQVLNHLRKNLPDFFPTARPTPLPDNRREPENVV